MLNHAANIIHQSPYVPKFKNQQQSHTKPQMPAGLTP